MITYLDYPDIGAVEIAVSSSPARKDFEETNHNLSEFSAACGPVSLCFSVENFSDGLSAVFWSDVQTMLSCLHEDSRVAFVTPERWRVWLMTSGKVLAPCEVRFYGLTHAARARGWLLSHESEKSENIEKSAA